jgi:hypothetical protein
MPTALHDGHTAPNIVAIMGELAAHPRDGLIVVLERCSHHMPRANALRSMAYGCGLIEGMLIARRYRHAIVGARRWQKEILGGLVAGETKPAALSAARRLWPNLDFWAIPDGCRKLHDGIIDAALLAEYARRKNL